MIDVVLKGMQFGLGLASSSTPVLGVGYRTNEAIVVGEGQPPYPNVIDQMLSQQFIGSRTYSLYLNDLDASTGMILFGGVDLDKFSGTLATLPINPDSNGATSVFFVTLTGMNLNTPGNGGITPIDTTSTFPLSVVLDSGTTFMNLPSAIVRPIGEGLGGTFSDHWQQYILPNCNAQSADASFDFIFSGVQISVPFNEIIVNAFNSEGHLITDDNGSPICVLGMTVDDSLPFGILGDTFLRSAYVVYDLVCFP